MRFRLFHFARPGVWVCVATALNLCCEAPGQQVTVSPTNNPAKASDGLSQITRRKDGLQRLEEELTRSLQSLAPKGSFTPIAPPEGSPRATITVRPRNDSKKDWADFLDNKPQEEGSEREDSSRMPEFNESIFRPPKQSSVEKLFDRIESRESSNLFKEQESSTAPNFDGAMRSEKEYIPPELQGPVEELRKVLDSARDGGNSPVFGANVGAGSGDSVFNYRMRQDPLATAAAPNPFVQQYREMLGFSAPSSLGTFKPPTAPNPLAPAYTPVSPDALAGSSPFKMEEPLSAQLPGNFNLRDPTEDVNQRVLSRWDTYTPPAIQDNSKRVVVQPPSFDAPRRKF